MGSGGLKPSAAWLVSSRGDVWGSDPRRPETEGNERSGEAPATGARPCAAFGGYWTQPFTQAENALSHVVLQALSPSLHVAAQACHAFTQSSMQTWPGGFLLPESISTKALGGVAPALGPVDCTMGGGAKALVGAGATCVALGC